MRDPFEITGYTVVANSGGKTSGYNRWLHMQANGGRLPEDRSVGLFNNTGWEDERTLAFLAEQDRRWGQETVVCEFTRRPASAAELATKEAKYTAAEARVRRYAAEPLSFFARKTRCGEIPGRLFDCEQTPEQRQAHTLRKARGYAVACWESWQKAKLIGIDSYRRVTLATASTDGRPFEELLEGLRKFREEVKGAPGVLPNGVQRICTGHLKVRSAASLAADLWPHVRFNDFECRLGLRADEEERVSSATDWGRDGGKATFPLYEAGITKADVAAFWAKQPFGLKLKSHEGNCGGCYMKRREALVDLIRREFFDPAWWQGWEERTGQRFRKERSYRGLVNAARTELQLIPPEDYDSAITCEGGYCTD